MKVFFDYEIISFWSYEESSWKNVAIVSILFSNCIKIFPRTHHTYLSKKYEFKSDDWFYEWSSVTFPKNESLGARKEKIVREANHVSCMKNAAC